MNVTNSPARLGDPWAGMAKAFVRYAERARQSLRRANHDRDAHGEKAEDDEISRAFGLSRLLTAGNAGLSGL